MHEGWNSFVFPPQPCIALNTMHLGVTLENLLMDNCISKTKIELRKEREDTNT